MNRAPRAHIMRWHEFASGQPNETRIETSMTAQGYAVRRHVYVPGMVFPPHVHEVDKCDAVVEGNFEVCCAGLRYVMTPGDLRFVSAGVEHTARVIGARAVVSLDGERL